MPTINDYEEKGEEYNTFIVLKNGKYGLINNKNKVLLPIAYDSISNWIEYGPQGHYIKQNGKFGFANFKGKVQFPCQYDRIYYNGVIEKFGVEKDGKWGLVDSNNKVFLPVAFKKIYIDVDFWAAQNDTIKGQIVVQDSNDVWSYLSLKDGSPIAKSVDKDTVFNRYTAQLFSNELVQAYKDQYKDGFIVKLDSFSKNIIDFIIQSKANAFVDFPNMHTEYFKFSPKLWYEAGMSIFKISNYLQSKGFEISFTGSYVDYRKRENVLYGTAKLGNCLCELAITFYPTYTKDKYKVVESLKCYQVKDKSFKMRRH